MSTYATDTFSGDGTTVEFTLTFPYISRDHVNVYRVENSDLSETKLTVIKTGVPSGDEYIWESDKKIKVGTAPKNDQTLRIQRDTPEDDQIVQWSDGSYMTAEDLNDSDQQWLYNIQELEDKFSLLESTAIKYLGTVDLTVDTAPANPEGGDYYINTGNGTVIAGWTGIEGDTVSGSEQVIYDGQRGQWEIIKTPAAQQGVLLVTGQSPIDVDNTDTQRPVVTFDSTGAGVLGVTGTSPVTVDNTDSQNPVIGFDTNSYGLWDKVTGGINYAGGNVGIGTTNPQGKLDVNNGANRYIKFEVEGTSGDNHIKSYQGSSENLRNLRISAQDLTIATAASSVSDGVERLSVKNNGYIGIGTTNPAAPLSVNSPNQNTAEVIAEFGNQTIAGGLQIQTNGNLDWGFNARNARNLTFSTNQSERMRIAAAGSVGIGTTSPNRLLTLNNALQPQLAFKVAEVETLRLQSIAATNYIDNVNQDLIFRGGAGTTDIVTFKNDGSVGIGTSNPGSLLNLRTNAGTNCTLLLNEASTANPLKIEQTATEARIQTLATLPLVLAGQDGQGSTSDIRFETRGTERVRITPDGNVGIGTVAPTTSLDIGTTDAVKVPVGTTAERPSSPAAGMFRFNDSTDKFEGHDGTQWGAIGGDIGEAPIDGNQYARQNATWTPVQGGDNNVTYNGASAWGNVAADGTLQNGLNIASVTRAAIGTYAVAFTTPMPSSDYAVNVTSNSVTEFMSVKAVSKTVNGFTVTAQSTNTGGQVDGDYSFAVHSQNALPPAGTTGTDAWGSIDGLTGNIVGSFNATSSKVSTGVYQVTFTNPMPDARYAPTVSTDQAVSAVVQGSVTTSGFQVATFNIAGTPTDGFVAFSVNATNANLPYTFTKEQIEAAINNTGAYAWASTAGDGTIEGGNGLTCTKTSTGVYEYTFNTPLPDADYAVSGSITDNGAWFGVILQRTASSFTWKLWDRSDSGEALDKPHCVVVTTAKGQPLSLGGGADAWGYVGSNGNLAEGHNIASVTRTSNGKYDVVFATPMPFAFYSVTTGVSSSGQIITDTYSSNGFSVKVLDKTGSSFQDTDFNFAVFATDGNAGGFWGRTNAGVLTPANPTDDVQIASLNTGQLAGFRNVLCNGTVTINQRNATYAGVSVGEYWADRWKKTAGGMTQIIEEGNYKPNTEYTLSGTGVTTQQITSPASGNWTIPDVPETATMIQLEEGPIATPYELRPIGAELALCQRYCFVSDGNTPAIILNNSEGLATLNFPVQMRSAPTAYRGDGASINTTNIQQANSSASYGTLGIISASSSGTEYFNYTKSGTAGSLNAARIESIRFEAEL